VPKVTSAELATTVVKDTGAPDPEEVIAQAEKANAVESKQRVEDAKSVLSKAKKEVVALQKERAEKDMRLREAPEKADTETSSSRPMSKLEMLLSKGNHDLKLLMERPGSRTSSKQTERDQGRGQAPSSPPQKASRTSSERRRRLQEARSLPFGIHPGWRQPSQAGGLPIPSP